MRIATRGAATGTCNTCGTVGPLTLDHIPPKQVPLVGQAELVSMGEFLGSDPASRKNRHFQKGIVFRSLCARCNNVLLGARYDPVLIDFTRRIHETAREQLYVPLEVPTIPNRLVRSAIAETGSPDQQRRSLTITPLVVITPIVGYQNVSDRPTPADRNAHLEGKERTSLWRRFAA